MKNQTELLNVPISKLITADWNYKKNGERDQIDRLKASIDFDKSVGVLAIRELEKDGVQVFEVIDGNHRLIAVREMNWEVVPCENFGKLSLAKAITIARRRNHKWFEDDMIKYGKLLSGVLEEYTVDELEPFMPDTAIEM